MAHQNFLLPQHTGSSKSSFSHLSVDYVDAPSSPTPSNTNTRDQVGDASERRLSTEDNNKRALNNEDVDSEPEDFANFNYFDFDLGPTTLAFSTDFEPSNSTPLLSNLEQPCRSKSRRESESPTNFPGDTRSLPSSTHHNPQSPSTPQAQTKSILKKNHPNNSNSRSPAKARHPSSGVMSFAPLPRSNHGNIDEIPLNSPMDDAAPEVEPMGFHPSRGFMLAFFSICIITLAAALDATSLAIALPIITGKLHGTAIEAFWSGTSFLITSAVFQPIIAGLSHIFGRKELILLSSAFFGVGSFMGAIAQNFTMMLAGRSIQGIGGGGILTLGEIMLTDLVPLAYRGAWFGYLGSVWAIGSVTGPLMGASFAQRVTWRWIFWINIPIIVTGSIAIFFFLKLDRIQGKMSDKLLRFDWFGSVIFCGSCVSILIPMTWGGVSYPWSHWRTIVPLLVGFAGTGGFLYYEKILSNKCWDRDGNPLPGNNIEPIIRFTIFNNSTMVLTYIQTVLHGIVLWSLLYFLPLYYEGVLEYSLILTGVAALPETGFVAPMAVVVGIVSAKTGFYRWAIWVGWALTTFGAGLLVLLKPDTSVVQWVFLNIPISLGTGMLFTAMGLAVQAAGIPEDAGHAAGFYSFARVIGQSLGVAIGGVVFQNQVYSNLLNYPLLAPMAKQYSKEATVLSVIITSLPPGPQKTQLIAAFSDALSMIWVVMCAIAGVGLLLSIFIQGYSLEQEHKTLQGYKYDGVDGDDERMSTSYGAPKYSSSTRHSHVYGGTIDSSSNLEMSNLGGGLGESNPLTNASTVSLDKEPNNVNRRRGATVSSAQSVLGSEQQVNHLAV
ncbi:MFS transporter [Podosphaera aphanis]|nr:MFS transporter [Podosphaera aphanis]